MYCVLDDSSIIFGRDNQSHFDVVTNPKRQTLPSRFDRRVLRRHKNSLNSPLTSQLVLSRCKPARGVRMSIPDRIVLQKWLNIGWYFFG